MSSTNEALTSQLGVNVRRLLRQVLGQPEGAEAISYPGVATAPLTRQSKGLREFWSALRTQEGLQILDFGPASQANINFITGLGHRLCTEDLYGTLQFAFSRAVVTPPAPDAPSPEERFFQENLRYGAGQFDGILCWDIFDLLDDPLVKPLADRLHQLLKPGGMLLSFFHAGQPGQLLSVCQYRICSQDQLQLAVRGQGKLRRAFNNRGIEGLFQKFTSLKFFLTRDSLREVVVVR
jgi:hypothetical protein